MRRRNLILITVLSLSLTFAAGCGENKNTGAAGSMDQQKTSETTVQNETEPETSQVSEDSEQDETEAAATTEAGQDAQSDYQIEMVSYKKTDLIDISYPKITGWSDTEKQEEWNTYFENTAKEAAGEMTGDTEEMNLGANDSVVLTYTVQEQTKDMLSLTCQSYYDYEGSAHPSAALTSVNINMKTGEKMTFSDFADPDETAKILFAGKDNTDTAQGYTVLDPEGNPTTEITMKDILEFNFIWMEPTEEALAASLTHFDGDVDDYGADSPFTLLINTSSADTNFISNSRCFPLFNCKVDGNRLVYSFPAASNVMYWYPGVASCGIKINSFPISRPSFISHSTAGIISFSSE